MRRPGLFWSLCLGGLCALGAGACTSWGTRSFAVSANAGGFPLDHRLGLTPGFDVYDDRMTSSAGPEMGERERLADVVVKTPIRTGEPVPPANVTAR